MTVRAALASDSDAVWAILEPVRAGETYTLPREMGRREALAFWFATSHECSSRRTAVMPLDLLPRPNQTGGGARPSQLRLHHRNCRVRSRCRPRHVRAFPGSCPDTGLPSHAVQLRGGGQRTGGAALAEPWICDRRPSSGSLPASRAWLCRCIYHAPHAIVKRSSARIRPSPEQLLNCVTVILINLCLIHLGRPPVFGTFRPI